MENNEPKLKKIKVNNSLAIGGMVAFGKSTLTKILSKELNFKEISEINERDPLTQLLLEKMYKREGNNTLGPLFQIFFLLERYKTYKKESNNRCIFDRTIFEDGLFAHENITDPHLFNYYSKLGTNKINDLLYTTGIPYLYIILDGPGELFKERIFKRARPYEIENFNVNETYFKSILEKYRNYLVDVCETHGIDYVVVNAGGTPEYMVQIIKLKLECMEAKGALRDRETDE